MTTTTIVQPSMIKMVESQTTKLNGRIDYSERERLGRFLHLGAGLQSSTLVEMLVEDELEPVDAIVFCDTKDEPSWVYDQVAYLRTRAAGAGIPLHVLEHTPMGLVRDTKYGDGRFASMPLFTIDADGKVGRLRRQCTKEYKIQPAHDFILDWLIDRDYARTIETKQGPRRILNRRDVYIESLFGISLDEFERATNRGPNWQKAVYPLIDRRMTRQACAEWLAARSLPVPEKSACRVCPYHDDEYWLWLKTKHPPDFAHACRFDAWLRSDEAAERLTLGLENPVYLHRSCQPLAEIDFEALTALDETPLAEFCGGHCMT